MRAVAGAAALALPALPAAASPLLERVGTVDGGGAALSRARSDMGAAYFNPARLAGAQTLEVSFAAGVAFDGLNVEYLARPDSADITADVYRARRVVEGGSERLEDRPLATADLPRTRGEDGPERWAGHALVGGASPLVPGRLAVGFFMLTPTDVFQAQRPHFVDEREQYFSNSLHRELGGDRLTANTVVAALGSAPTGALRLGVGVSMVTRAIARSEVFVPDASDQSAALVNSAVEVRTAFAPHGSAEVDVGTAATVALVAHAPQRSRVDGETAIRFWNYTYEEGRDAELQNFAFSYGYLPWRLALAATARPVGARVELAASVGWHDWSRYVDRHSERPTLGWHDTIDLGVGATARFGVHRVDVEGNFTPSPVPTQVGRSNYVDNAEVGVGAGWRAQTDARGRGFEFFARGRALVALARTHRKDVGAADPVLDEFPDAIDSFSEAPIVSSAGLQTNNPGYPGYRSYGVSAVLTVGMSVGAPRD